MGIALIFVGNVCNIIVVLWDLKLRPALGKSVVNDVRRYYLAKQKYGNYSNPSNNWMKSKALK